MTVETPTGDSHVQEGRDAARLAYLSDAWWHFRTQALRHSFLCVPTGHSAFAHALSLPGNTLIHLPPVELFQGQIHRNPFLTHPVCTPVGCSVRLRSPSSLLDTVHLPRVPAGQRVLRMRAVLCSFSLPCPWRGPWHPC